MRTSTCKHFYWSFRQEIQIPFINASSLIYLRFIYNLLFKLAGSKIDLVRFLKQPSMKLLYEKISKEKTSFLDTEIYFKDSSYILKYLERKQTTRLLKSTWSTQNHYKTHLLGSFFNKVAGLQACKLIKERLLTHC